MNFTALPLMSFVAPTALVPVRDVVLVSALIVVVVLLITSLTGAGST
jgi:hypothetical protein